jgi:two-component system, cell cycle sensor histidine kinase and response regulator CckA
MDENRYQELFNNAPDIVFAVDLTGKLMSVNAAGLRISRYTLDEVIGKPFIQFIAAEDVELVFKMMQRKLAGDVTTTVYEIHIATKNGNRVPIEISSWLIHESGQPAGVQGIGRDVTERNQMVQQLLQAKQDEVVAKLAGGVAHDFNNLLTVILGRSELLRGQFTPNHPMRKEIDFIREAAERAAVITRQLLTFSRKQTPQPAILDFNALITKMSNWLQHLLGEHVRLVCDLSPDLKAIKADPVQIEQVILNLALNARDAMPTGGMFTLSTSNIESTEAGADLEAARPGTYVLLSASDTGKGMDPQTMSNIFEPFYTTKGGRGFGLGLPIVQKIVSISGGSMRVQSESGKGSTFKIYLPGVPHVAGVPEVLPPVVAGGTETLLLVDDESALLSLVGQNLRAEGYTVLQAGSAEDAVRLYEENFGLVDLVLTDVVLPNMSGPELAEHLVGLQPGLPVLFMSGYPDEVIQHHGIFQGAVNLLEKPFTRTELGLKVRQALDIAKIHSKL